MAPKWKPVDGLAVSVNWRMDKQTVVYTYDEILSN